jgi:hypothetical protein
MAGWNSPRASFDKTYYSIDKAGPDTVLCPAYKEPTAFHENPVTKNFFVYFACAQCLRVEPRVQGVLIVVKKG